MKSAIVCDFLWCLVTLLLASTATAAEPAREGLQVLAGCVPDDPAVFQPIHVRPQTAPVKGAPGSLDLASSWKDVGDSALERGDLVFAQTAHRRALIIRQELAPRSLIVAESLNALGNVALERGDLTTARRYLDQSLVLRRSLSPTGRDVALSLISLGNLARLRGELTSQEAYFRQALQMTDVLTPEDRADALDGLGSACSQRSCDHRPREYFLQALQIRQQRQPESLALADTLTYLGRSENSQGNLGEAAQLFGRALELRRRLAPGSLAMSRSLTDVGVAARSRGNLAVAELCLRQGLKIRERLVPDGLGVADSLHNLAIVFSLRDDLESAQEYLRQALRIRRLLIPGSPALAQTLIWEGLLCVRREELDEAQRYFTQALALLKKEVSPDSLAIASVLSNLGNVARARDDLESARQDYRRALVIQQKVAPESPVEANTLQALGGLARRANNLPEAESDFRQALAIQARESPDSSAYVGTLFALASLLRFERQPQEAQRSYAQAVDALERQTGILGGTPEERSIFRARFENSYKDYVAFLIALGRPDTALQVSERARAWALMEMLTTARVSLEGEYDGSLDRLRQSLEEEIGARSSYRIRLLDEHGDANQLSEVDRQLAQLRSRYREAQQQLQTRNPAYGALIHPQTLASQEVQGLLDDQTLLLEYSLGGQNSYVWAVTSSGLAAYRLPPRRILEQSVMRMHELLTARTPRRNETDERRHKRIMRADAQYPAAALDLSQIVLSPVAGLLDRARVVVVSDGALQNVPFAALPLPSSQQPGKRSAGEDTLVMQHEIVNLPSASVLAELRRQASERGRPPKEVAVLADPVFDHRDERILRSGEYVPTGVHASPTVDRISGVDRLLWTRLEAEQIMKVTPAGMGLKALDFEANRQTALSPVLSQYRIVHFATHAVSDNAHPERSGLVLSLFDQHGQPQNGFLGLEQIYGMKLPADLVVLSACETALGRDVSGEGQIGLVRGFMYAGASRVIASLWRVDDEVTAELMGRMYEHLEHDGMSPAAALRAAQMEIRKVPQWNAPYYWAGFQVQGEWR